MNFDNPFQTQKSIQIDQDTKVIFVADLFADQYSGGAELTTEALIKSCPYKFQKILSKDVDISLLELGHQIFWIFCNFASLDLNLIPTIVSNMNYSVIEYDYKYCRYRSPEKHEYVEGLPCDCQNEQHGKLVSAFYLGAKNLFWMSEKQMNHYTNMFPFLLKGDENSPAPLNIVLSSVFDDDFFVKIHSLNDERKVKNGTWVVLGSTSWVKGFDQAEKWLGSSIRKVA